MARGRSTARRYANRMPFQRCPMDSRLSRCLCRQARKVKLDRFKPMAKVVYHLLIDFRFMRGEREHLLNTGYRPGIRGDATPSTPSTASTTVRQNPLMYQRMHSSDSDKEKNSD